MIKLMIADDEAGIRKGLMHYIDWSTWNINLVAEASDGDEAFNKALRVQPDILLSDIRMPGRTGLQLAKDLMEVLPSLRVILLTGHSDTAYLQEALKIGIKDYLLKPAGAEKIIESVLKVKEEILAEQNVHQENIRKDAIIIEGIPILQMHFMDDLVKGRIANRDAIVNKAKRLKIPLNYPFHQVGLLRIGAAESSQLRSEKEQSMDAWHLIRTFTTIVEQFDGSFFVELEPELFLWVLGATSETQLKKAFQLMAEEIFTHLPPKTYPMTAMGIGSMVDDLTNFPETYENAHSALRQSAWEPDTRIFSSLVNPDPTHLQEARRLKKAAAQAITQEKFVEGIDYFEAMFDEFKKARADIDEVKEACHHLLVLAAHYNRSSPSAELDENLNMDIAHLEALPDAQKILEWVKSRLSNLINGEPYQISPLVSKAQAYIRKHYAEEITLQNLALELFASPNYLGRIFREQTGYKLSDWLNKYRIEKAKSLLDNPELKIYEVSDKVGFSSYKYFSVCFLKYAGCSARDYRNKPRQKKEKITIR